MTGTVAQQQLRVMGKTARVHMGGAGEGMLLVHGGWPGGARHWATVWDLFATRFWVIAPDLPGLSGTGEEGLDSVAEYVQWLVELLDVVGMDRVLCVGNSFGGSVVWSLAGRHPERCTGLVMVNGIPMPKTPAVLWWFGRTALGRWLMRAALRKGSYNADAVQRAFVDPDRIPDELRAMDDHRDLLVKRFADIVIAGDGPPTPRVTPLLVFGEGDRLPATGPSDARKLHASLPGSQLRFIAKAGHFPQIECPEAFVEAIEAYATR